MTLTDYSDLEKEIKDAPEPQILPAGSEVKARIVTVNSGSTDKTESGEEAGYFSVVYDVPNEPLCPMFSDFFWDLTDRDKIGQKAYNNSLRQFRTFAEAFNLDYSRPFSWEDDLPGLEGWVILGVKKDKTGEYPPSNKVSKYVTGPADRDDIPF